jgi:hypothetical protein
MSDSNRMSRRDWFRLLPSRAGSMSPTDNEVGASQAADEHSAARPPGLQAIPHPENHDGMNLAALPPMCEAVLSEEQVRQLFADLEAVASDVHLMQRLAGAARATPSAASSAEQLHAAQQSLLTGAIARCQIRYQWQGIHWIDTLERRDAGVRLVRIAHDLRRA